MKVTLECLVCGAAIIVKDRIFEQVDELVKVWERQHEPCKEMARERVPAGV